MTNAEGRSINMTLVLSEKGRRGFQRGRNRRLRPLWVAIQESQHKNNCPTPANKLAFETNKAAAQSCIFPILYRLDLTFTRGYCNRRPQETPIETRSDATKQRQNNAESRRQAGRSLDRIGTALQQSLIPQTLAPGVVTCELRRKRCDLSLRAIG